jgi:urea transport system permease protein
MTLSLKRILLVQVFVMSCSLLGFGAIGWAQESGTSSTPIEIIGVDHAMRALTDGAWTEKKIAVAYLIEHGEPDLLPQLEELRSNVNRRVRRLMKPVINLLRNKANLVSEDSEARRAAARDLGTRGGPEALPLLKNALSTENDRWVRYDLEEAINLINLEHADPQVRLAAITKLGDLRSAFALPDLEELAQQPADNLEQQTLTNAAAEASRRIQQWHDIAGGVETLLQGLSLSSILLLMALGLAIVFGLMGVINMAHGEMMMIGAYATFVVQEIFRAYLGEQFFDYYFIFALPCAFFVAAFIGWILEGTLIRFLYGRPLETLLVTWGVGLVLIQGARVIFGDLTAVQAPSWLKGGVQIMVGVRLPHNRLFIILLAIFCVAGIYLLLYRTGIGLRIRAVLQNREMSACLGIPTRKLDAYTFAFGSGLAGLAGSALTLVGNVDPELGRNYIVDSFMVVVAGGVGKLAGTIIAALGIGTLNKLLEPSFGAVYGKVTILVLIILFLQFRPSGLFTMKGRHLDS